MTARITIIKNYRNKETLRLVELQELASIIREGEMLMAVVQKPRMAATNDSDPVEEGRWMSLKDISALLKKHFKGYKEDTGSFQKIGNYLNRPEYKFQSRHAMDGNYYWVKLKV
ncbi:MAG: hypothetical protein IJ159_05725 [Prevotella sp.]|nr:hypothetical protein [Prevotella sp.]